MNQLWQDVVDNTQGYYDNLITLLPKLAVALAIATGGWLFFKLVKKSLQSRLNKVIDDPLIAKFIIRVVRVIMVITVMLICLKVIGLGKIATGLWGTAGIGAFVIGFAFKDIGEHLLAGFMLAFSRPFRNGDIVEVNGVKGKVVGLTMRNTHLKTFSGKDVYIPNGIVIKNVLTNDTIDGFIRYNYSIEIPNDANLAMVESTLLEVINEQKGVLQDERAPSVWVDGLVAGKITVTVRYWHNTFDRSVDSASVRRQAIAGSVSALRVKGIEIPVTTTSLLSQGS